MIRKISSFGRALAILSILETNEHLSNNENRWWVEAYQNGREQGILFWNSGKVAYYLSEHRNSDQIVVYKGSYNMQSLSDDAYQHSNFFSHVEDAVDWLVEELTQ